MITVNIWEEWLYVGLLVYAVKIFLYILQWVAVILQHFFIVDLWMAEILLMHWTDHNGILFFVWVRACAHVFPHVYVVCILVYTSAVLLNTFSARNTGNNILANTAWEEQKGIKADSDGDNSNTVYKGSNECGRGTVGWHLATLLPSLNKEILQHGVSLPFCSLCM